MRNRKGYRHIWPTQLANIVVEQPKRDFLQKYHRLISVACVKCGQNEDYAEKWCKKKGYVKDYIKYPKPKIYI